MGVVGTLLSSDQTKTGAAIVQSGIVLEALSRCCSTIILWTSKRWVCTRCLTELTLFPPYRGEIAIYIFGSEENKATLNEWLSFWTGFTAEELDVKVTYES